MTGEGRCGRWKEEVGLPSVVGNVIKLSRGTDVEILIGSSATVKKNPIFSSKELSGTLIALTMYQIMFKAHFIVPKTRSGRYYYYYSYFTSEETEAHVNLPQKQ